MQERLLWADAAKGVSIFLVVFWHITGKHFPIIEEQLAAPAVFGIWQQISLYLEPSRMPLFFILAGMFASSALSRPWSAVWRKPTNSYYIFVVWLALSIPIALAIGSLAGNPIDNLKDAAAGLFLGATGPWFMFALAIYFTGAKIGLKMPRWIIMFLAVGVAVISFAGALRGTGNLHYVVENAFFFLVGAYFPQVPRRLAHNARLRISLPLFCLALAVGWAVTYQDFPLYPIARLLAGAIGCSALLMLISSVCVKPTPPTKALAWVGQRTLGIYLLHLNVLVLLQLGVLCSGLSFSGIQAETIALLYAPLVLVVTTALSVGITTALERMGLRFLFHLPSKKAYKLKGNQSSLKPRL